MTKPVSPRALEVLEFIKDHIDEKGFPPTVREIGAGVDMSSPSTVQGYIVTLCENGLLERSLSGSPRALRVVRQATV